MTIVPTTGMSANEANALIARIRDQLGNVRALVLELHDRRGWLALGYTSWRECCQQEFGYGENYIYKIIAAAKVDQAINAPLVDKTQLYNCTVESSSVNLAESHARELARLPEPETIRTVYQEVTTERGEKATAADYRAAVDRHLETHGGLPSQRLDSSAGNRMQVRSISIPLEPDACIRRLVEHFSNDDLMHIASAIEAIVRERES